MLGVGREGAHSVHVADTGLRTLGRAAGARFGEQKAQTRCQALLYF